MNPDHPLLIKVDCHERGSALTSLIAPFTSDEFLAQHWEQAPLRISRNDSEYFNRLMTPEECEDALAAACLRNGEAVELLGEAARTLPPFKRDSAFAAGAAFERGATIRIVSAHRFHPPLLRLTRELERFFSFPVRINLYWTPEQQQGLNRHWDTHDVLVLQVAGRKHWRVFDSPVALPLQSPPPLPFEDQCSLPRGRGAVRTDELMRERSQQAELRDEFTLEQGDALYIPRGFVHEAWTSDQASAHLTIGIHVLTWTDLLTVMLGRVANRDERFRRALPVGFATEMSGDELQEQARQLWQTMADHAEVADAFEEMAEIFIRTRSSIGGDLNAGSPATLSEQSIVARRSGLLCRLIVKDDVVALYYGHGEFGAPRAMEEALRFIARTERFRVPDIPGGLNRRSQLALARRLISDRFLRIVNTSASEINRSAPEYTDA
ncbi:MAG: cupin domain-containing protein [Blastocatellia bacterium]